MTQTTPESQQAALKPVGYVCANNGSGGLQVCDKDAPGAMPIYASDLERTPAPVDHAALADKVAQIIYDSVSDAASIGTQPFNPADWHWKDTATEILTALRAHPAGGVGDGATTCLFCAKPLGADAVYDDTNGVSACKECGNAEISAQAVEAGRMTENVVERVAEVLFWRFATHTSWTAVDRIERPAFGPDDLEKARMQFVNTRQRPEWLADAVAMLPHLRAAGIGAGVVDTPARCEFCGERTHICKQVGKPSWDACPRRVVAAPSHEKGQ